jgi:hypothetical protein
MKDDLEWVLEEAVVAWKDCEKLRKTRDIRCPGRDLNRESIEFKSKMLPLSHLPRLYFCSSSSGEGYNESHNFMKHVPVAVEITYKTIIPLIIRIKVFMAVVMKSYTFWDITPCSPLKVNGCFGVTCRLHIHK